MPPTTSAKSARSCRQSVVHLEDILLARTPQFILQSNAVSNAELTPGGRHMGPKSKGRKSKGRKGQGGKRKSEWWSENFFAIRDLIWAIYFRVEEPDPAKPSLDDLFRKLRARIDTFEAQCRKKTGAR